MSEKEMVLAFKELREKGKGLITKYPRFIPPQPDLPPMTPHQQSTYYDICQQPTTPAVVAAYWFLSNIIPQDMFLEDMLSHPEENYIEDDIYRGPAQAPGELSLPEEDDRVRKVLYGGLEATRRKKILGESISKQKNKAASSSRNQ